MAISANPLHQIEVCIVHDARVLSIIRGISSMQVYPGITVGDFKRRFEYAHKLKSDYIDVISVLRILPDSLTERALSDSLTIDRLIVGNRLYVRVALKVFQIFVVTLTGKSITIDNVDAAHTIGDIKEKISQKEKISFSDLRILYQSRTLEDERHLHHYQIVNESNLRLVVRLRGGGTASFMMREPAPGNVEIFDKNEMGEGSSSIDKGLNLKAKCSNTACEYYNKDIWVSSGISHDGPFDLRTEANRSRCPHCDALTDSATNLGFYDCSYSYSGKYNDGEEVKEAAGKYTTPPNKFATLPEEVEQLDWIKLDITVTPRKKWFSCLTGCCCC